MRGRNPFSLARLAAAAPLFALAIATSEVPAQVVAATGSYGGAADPNPYYIGISEALTHDSNVYRIPNGAADSYSSTSLFGGFDQPISRQRVFGRGSVTLNRYREQDLLDNTGYNFYGGVDWETVENLSGNLYASYNHSLAAPVAAAGVPVQQSQNIADVASVSARARWGGPSLFTLQGSLDYASVGYSEPAYVTS